MELVAVREGIAASVSVIGYCGLGFQCLHTLTHTLPMDH